LSLNLTFSCVAQLPSFHFHHVTTSNGLSDGVVRAIGQDKYGYIWIATLSGLNRYNGYTVKQYQNVAGDSLSLPPGITRSLLGDAAGNLWIGTNSGLYQFDYTNSQFHQILAPVNFTVLKMIEYAKDVIYLATNQGLARFTPSTKRISFYKYSNSLNKELLSFGVKDLFLYRQSIYIATDSGLVIFDTKVQRSRLIQLPPVKEKSISRIAVDGSGNVWASYGLLVSYWSNVILHLQSTRCSMISIIHRRTPWATQLPSFLSIAKRDYGLQLHSKEWRCTMKKATNLFGI
jgi:ligand-binding sensor domain-containing protein